MDGQRGGAMTDDELDDALTAAACVDPSAEFRARVRTRIGRATMLSPWSRWAPVCLASALAVAIALMVTAGRKTANPVSDEQAAYRAVPHGNVAPVAPSISANVLAPLTQRTRVTDGAAADARREALPETEQHAEVLVSESEQAGVRLLFEAVASGTFELPPEMLHDLPVLLATGDDMAAGEIQ
jgi:hypothetical protein